MTKEDLEKTVWAQHFKAECPISYPEAIERALAPDFAVEIVRTRETEEVLYAVVDYNNNKYSTGFWMDTFKSKHKAVKFCEKMGWKIIDETA